MKLKLIPEKLKAVRDKLGIGRVKLAKKIDVTPSSIYSWETGRTTPYQSSIENIIKKLGIKTLDLCEIIEEDHKDKQRLPKRIFFPHKVTHFRVKLGLFKKDLAKRMGVNPSEISRWESGKHDPTTATIQRMAKALGISISQISSPRHCT